MHKDGRIKIMLRNKPKAIPVPAVGDVVTESHKYETGTVIVPFPTIDEADRDKVQISWRCVGQTVIMDPVAASDTYRWTLVVTWQCESVEWVRA